ncbi:MAG TPA: tetratricopeptide repeat protein [Blastocatellia bacterium]|nr:tetratricopeptide repeat protein [Blastocatellia bacterium]
MIISLIRRTAIIALITNALFLLAAQAQDNKESPISPPKVIRKSTGVLQNEAIKRVEPAYPPLALAAKISGSVTVEITVDEEGNVISARAVSGHPLLKDSAIEASRKWKFKPMKLSGTPVKVIGNIVFNFTLKGEKQKADGEEQNNKSIDALEKEARDNPNSDEAHYELGVAYSQSGRYNEAIKELKEAIRINPKSADAHYKLAVAYSYSEHYPEAIETFEKTVRIDPDYWNNDAAYFGLGMVNLKVGKYEEAINALKESIKLSPAVAHSHIGLGIAHFMLGNYKEAVSPFKRVLELNRALGINAQSANAHYWLGKTYLRLGDKQSALKEYQALKQIDKERAEQLLIEIDGK